MVDWQKLNDEEMDEFYYAGIDSDPTDYLRNEITKLRKENEDLKKAYYESQAKIALLSELTTPTSIEFAKSLVVQNQQLNWKITSLSKAITSYGVETEQIFRGLEEIYLKFHDNLSGNRTLEEMVGEIERFLSEHDREPWTLGERYYGQTKSPE